MARLPRGQGLDEIAALQQVARRRAAFVRIRPVSYGQLPSASGLKSSKRSQSFGRSSAVVKPRHIWHLIRSRIQNVKPRSVGPEHSPGNKGDSTSGSNEPHSLLSRSLMPRRQFLKRRLGLPVSLTSVSTSRSRHPRPRFSAASSKLKTLANRSFLHWLKALNPASRQRWICLNTFLWHSNWADGIAAPRSGPNTDTRRPSS